MRLNSFLTMGQYDKIHHERKFVVKSEVKLSSILRSENLAYTAYDGILLTKVKNRTFLIFDGQPIFQLA